MGPLRSPLARAGAIGTVAAIVVNVILFGIGSAASIDWEAGDNDPNIGAVIFSTIVGGVIFTIIAMVLLRNTKAKRPTMIFVVVASILTLLSLAAPFGAEANTSTQTLLALMHIVVGVLVIGALARVMMAAERGRSSE